jgi:hypothetical protein
MKNHITLRVKFADVPQLKQAMTQSFAKWFMVVLAIPQLGQAAEDRRMVRRVALLEFIEKLLDGNSSAPVHIKLYRELHLRQHQY